MMRYDCLLIGHNERKVTSLYNQLEAMGCSHADFRDLDLNVINHNDGVLTVMDAINYFRYDKDDKNFDSFNNGDLLWNVIVYLGTYLNKHGLSFDHISLFQKEKGKLRDKLYKNEYKAIAITTTVYTMVEPVIEIIEFIKYITDKSIIIVGGPLINKQTSGMRDEDKQLFYKVIGADIYIDDREGENTLATVVSALKSGGTMSMISNVVYLSEGKYIINPVSAEYNELDENSTDYSLFDPKEYRGSMNIRISKGCPYNCSFCGFPKRSNKYKYLSVDAITNNLNQVNELNISNVFFMDDSVNVPKHHFKALMREMSQRKYNFTWNCFFRCDQCDNEMIELMKEANCEGVFLGLESADDTILKAMNKSSKRDHFEQMTPIFQKNNITVFISIITGFPGETFETFRKTIQFIEYLKVDFYRPQLWYCDPVTPIWEKRNEFGLIGSNFSWKHNTMSVSEACDLNEWAFFYLNEPVWTPDPGFNFISIYYMKKRGYTVPEIKDLLKSFNAIIKLKLIGSKNQLLMNTAKQNLIHAINRETDMINQSFVDSFSGMSYQNTEKYIKNEFNLSEIHYSSLSVNEDLYDSVIRHVLFEESTADDIYTRVYSKAITIMNTVLEKDFLNVICHNDKGFIPLRINCNLNIKKQLIQKMSDASIHGTFGLHIFSHNKQYASKQLSCDLLLSDIDLTNEFNEGIYRFGLSIICDRSQQHIRIRYLVNSISSVFAAQLLDSLVDITFNDEYDIATPTPTPDKLDQLTRTCTSMLDYNHEFDFNI